ncbi:hypothetical protein D9Q98_008237 [Chlorella vulgaris]|uniref:Uncharacterized protein n=1 Tax=Chlorella vulgaris TaxID=3077 RepID=A0A9D4YT18_CHLVU|nr:hypothetical protein D9Q98_008237 [Chlorella vulgaris]
MEQHGRATATGEQIHTSVERTPGGVRASSSSRSTGTGAPQQHEETVLHARAGQDQFATMSTHDLKAWLQTRGADLTGAIERHDLEEIARTMQDSGPPGRAEVGQGGAAQD